MDHKKWEDMTDEEKAADADNILTKSRQLGIYTLSDSHMDEYPPEIYYCEQCGCDREFIRQYQDRSYHCRECDALLVPQNRANRRKHNTFDKDKKWPFTEEGKR